jgi:putative endonuclease
LYIGVTSDLRRRLSEHQMGKGSAFTAKYNVKHLIYYETYNSIMKAIEREKQLKNWNRDWKLELIKSVNPHLCDLKNDIQFL